MGHPLPEIVARAEQRARDADFSLSCEPGVGRLLAVLAAAVPAGGRILEIGSGAGVGTSWLVHGLRDRSEVSLISVELDPATAAIARREAWPESVSLRTGDILTLLDELGRFDLIFADAQGGKWYGLERTIAALRPQGLLLVDDMTPSTWINDEHRQHTARVRKTLLDHLQLQSAELAEASGMILCVRRA